METSCWTRVRCSFVLAKYDICLSLRRPRAPRGALGLVRREMPKVQRDRRSSDAPLVEFSSDASIPGALMFGHEATALRKWDGASLGNAWTRKGFIPRDLFSPCTPPGTFRRGTLSLGRWGLVVLLTLRETLSVSSAHPRDRRPPDTRRAQPSRRPPRPGVSSTVFPVAEAFLVRASHGGEPSCRSCGDGSWNSSWLFSTWVHLCTHPLNQALLPVVTFQ